MDQDRRKNRPTQKDVARLAGVSQVLVSYVVNDNASVTIPDPTRKRIHDAIRELGYVPDSTARRLRSRKTHTIAAVIPDITNPFYPELQRGIQDVADRQGYDLLTVNTDGMNEKESRCLALGFRGHVDGLIVVLFHNSTDELSELAGRGVAVVRLESGAVEAGPSPVDTVYPDNMGAAWTAVNHLIERGHRRIGLIAGIEGPGPARRLGYERALADHGIARDSDLIAEGNFQTQGGGLAMLRLMSLANPPTAVFAANDLMAIGAMNIVKKAMLAIPDDMAIVGVDDIPAASYVHPALTTIALHPYRIGARAAELLFARLNGMSIDEGKCEVMPFDLIIRDSA